jgi:glyoxylase-like metal-dependent hydrolase (beta-lactamase superfamily II)
VVKKHQIDIGLVLLVWCEFVLVLLCGPTQAQETLPGYEWIAVSDGIYLSTQTDPFRGPVDGNCVVLVNDRDVVVIDTHINPAVARHVVHRIRSMTDKPVSWILNTHWHDDHTNGNGTFRDAFPGVAIVSHEATLQTLQDRWQAFEDGRLAGFRSVADVDLEAEARKVEADDPDRAAMLRTYAEYRDALLPELPQMALVYPDVTFHKAMRLLRGDRSIEIRHLGVGNTDGDAVVWLPQERILITGDLVVSPVPYAYEVDFTAWIQTLRKILGMQPRLLIPGHGRPMQDLTHVEQLLDLFDDTLTQVQAAASRGSDLQEVLSEVRLEKYAVRFAGEDAAARAAFERDYRIPAIRSVWATLHPDEAAPEPH